MKKFTDSVARAWAGVRGAGGGETDMQPRGHVRLDLNSTATARNDGKWEAADLACDGVRCLR
jgi:hypothetical protein